MDFRKLYLQKLFSDTLKSAFKPEMLRKAIKHPRKIPGTLHQFYKNGRDIMSDVKLKPLSTEYLLNTVSSSVSALATLSSRQSSATDIKNIKDVFGPSGSNPADAEALSTFLKIMAPISPPSELPLSILLYSGTQKKPSYIHFRDRTWNEQY